MIEIISNRDMGDEHVERDAPIITIRGPYGGGPFTLVNASTDRLFHFAPLYGNTSQYLCSSDRYDHEYVYAHGDDGDAVKE